MRSDQVCEPGFSTRSDPMLPVTSRNASPGHQGIQSFSLLQQRQPAKSQQVDDRTISQQAVRAERKWKDAIKIANIKTGCRTLLFYTFVLLARTGRDVYMRHYGVSCKPTMSGSDLVIRIVLELCFLTMSTSVLIFCLVRPRLTIYFPMVCFWYIFMTAQSLPPMIPSCQRLAEVFVEEKASNCETLNRHVIAAVRTVDCTLQGPTAMQMLMTFILTSHRFIPRYYLMKPNLFYIFFGYLPVSLAWHHWKESIYSWWDIAFSVLLLWVCQEFAKKRRAILENTERKRYEDDFNQESATRKIFNLLRIMVPAHVVAPMLINPSATIADHVDTVSILFIMILDFDEKGRSMTPEELLRFLNTNFEAWDIICARHSVTQIETVREEYVAAGGVVPEDIKVTKEQGHDVILGRLMRAAAEILMTQSSEVQLKMGLHTGPIVAGVIGQKLPRFRLFGDTINTAARMMQKGQPGELQFGDQTRALLPDWVGVKSRGEIEMKGKGRVAAHLLDRGCPGLYRGPSKETPQPQTSGAPAAAPGSRGRQRRTSVTEMIAAGTFAEADGESPDATSPSAPHRAAAGDVAEAKLPPVEIEMASKGPAASNAMEARSTGSSFRKSALVELVTSSISGDSKEAPEREASTSSSSSSAARRAARQPRFANTRRDLEASDTEDSVIRPFAQSQEVPAKPDEDEAIALEFEEVVRRLAKARDAFHHCGCKAVLTFGLRTSWFTDALEEEWHRWHHRTRILHHLSIRLHRHSMGLLFLSLCDIGYFVWTYFRGAIGAHMIYKGLAWRLPAFIFFRVLALTMIGVWERQARKEEALRRMARQSDSKKVCWMQANGRSMELLLLLTYCAVVVLIFMSYDALSCRSRDMAEDLDWDGISKKVLVEKVKQHMGHRMRRTGINSFMFVTAFYVITFEHPLPFAHNLAFFVVAALLMWFTRLDFWKDAQGNSGFSMYWSVTSEWNFFVVSVVNVLTAYSSEMKARSRFKALKNLERTRNRGHDILERLMPPGVVETIRNLPPHAPPPSHNYSRATIAQSDLSGFTKLSATRTPAEVVHFMSELFGRFDVLTDKRGIWKVETVGDAYIAGQAEKPLTATNSAVQVVLFGQDMVRAVHEWALNLGVNVTCRVGVHFGSCIGGIVGTVSQRYHIFGDLMSVVEVLESTGIESAVHVSKACKEEVERQKAEDASVKGGDQILEFTARAEPHLQTSKGEVHHYDEVGGTTYMVHFRYPPEWP